ncbi:MAG TPA: inositol monophosphatase family protein [Vicinamibacteria bacterium]|nr:inositol monophosphatase family protein [Vicinamibacteria bacterium]
MADALLPFALELAGLAEREILTRFRKAAVERKSDGTVVTEADRVAERVMRERIAERFPEDAILGEEHGRSGPGNARRTWVLDPVDGTIWFTLGVPTFGTLIGLLENREPVLGVAHFPALGETLFAARGEGCYARLAGEEPRRVRVAPPAPLREARVSAGGPHGSDILPEAGTAVNLTALVRSAGAFRFVGDCLQHALVCQGRLHAALDTVMKPWDVAALVPCVREAGGVATGLDGRDEGVVFAGSLLTSCDPDLHDCVLATLRG